MRLSWQVVRSARGEARLVPGLCVCALAALVLGGSAGATPAAVGFAPAVDYPVVAAGDASPRSLAVGDLNGDGKPDLVTANSTADNVSVLLGKGDGTFRTAVTYAVQSNPVSVAIGDLNGDGRLDLAVVNSDSDSVSVLLGKGDGTFQAATNYLVGQIGDTLSSVAIGDLNSDGKLDLAVADATSGNVVVLPGHGDGTFASGVASNTGQQPVSVAIGDLNGDGKLDLVTADATSNRVSVLLGRGDGTFQAPVNDTVGQTPSAVAIGDLNGDGRADIASANRDSNTVSVLLGNGDGTFQAPRSFAAGTLPVSVAIGDLNGDGRPDLATASSDAASVRVLLGDGDGSFEPATGFAAGQDPVAVAIGDLNGDGRPDLAVAARSANAVSVLLNAGPDVTPPTITIATGPNDTVAASGWYSAASSGTDGVEVDVSATDPSGVKHLACTDGQTTVLDTSSATGSFALHDGRHSISCTASDGINPPGAGPGSTPMPVEVDVDQTAPSLNPSLSPSPLYLHTTGATASPGASDDTSGVALQSCGAVDTGSAGDHTVLCTATDGAGNGNSATFHYTVEYKILGFFSPAPSSKWKTGQTVPIKIALADVNGVRISDPEAAGLLSPACSVTFSASGAQTLNPVCMKYDSANHQFIYTWKLGNQTGPETITATVTYAGTNTTTTTSLPITLS
jgi:hypothetical protein